MIPIARNITGESLPILTPDTTKMFYIDGSIAHAQCSPINAGIYRIAVRESTSDLGAMVKFSLDGESATTTSGLWMAQGSVEYFVLQEGTIIDVIDAKLNVTPFF